LEISSRAQIDYPLSDSYLSIRGISKTYREGRSSAEVLGDVSLEVRSGEFVSILGPSGCGKSTLLNIVAGLLPPTRGTVTLGGQIVTRPTIEMIYLFQQYSKSLFPWRRVRENVALGIEAHARRRSRGRSEIRKLCDECLALVGLQNVGHLYPWQLSGGMQQRVAIARALIAGPRVLLMDEPFSAVDALARNLLQDLILDIWRRLNITILFVTHDVDEAIYLADRVLTLSKPPVRIVDDIELNLLRPRRQVETRESSDFLRYRRALYARVTAG
jgi:NitT/TauT family transport system ATP-binding protein